MDIIDSAIDADLEEYRKQGGKTQYPFPVEDFAHKVFQLDIQYEDFTNIIDEKGIDPKDIFGLIFPEKDPLSGFERVIYINTNRNPFKIGSTIIPAKWYAENSERQTVAHEVGHFSDYTHHRPSQLSFFSLRGEAKLLDYSSVLLSKEDEVFANKYARRLLMPEKEIKDLINKKGIVGSIDLRLWENLFSEHFGVTRYMTEVRLKECGVRFLNGVYIKNFNNFKGKNYTLEDLKLLFELGKSFDQELNYYSAEAIVSLFNKATGEVRASGPIYMAYRRLMKGEYDSAFPELSEMRLSFLASKEVEIQKRKELEG